MNPKGLEVPETNDTENLLRRMIAAKQVSPSDAESIQQHLGDLTEGAASEAQVLEWLAGEYGLDFTDFSDVEPDRQMLSLFPARVLLKHGTLPLRRVGDVIEVATSALFATEGLDTLRMLTGLRLKPVLAPNEIIQREMKKWLGVGADTLDTLSNDASIQVIDERAQENIDLDDAAEDASIIRFVNQVLSDAIALRATDIHIEPFEEELRIRYRVDGVLQETAVPPQIKRYQSAIVSRVKILSHLDIAEKRLPQDGRIKVLLENNEVDVRVSLIPMIHGEAVVMRLLRQGRHSAWSQGIAHGPPGARPVQRYAERPARHHSGHRPHRQWQDHNALLSA